MRELMFLVAERRICISCWEKFNIPLKLEFLHRLVLSPCPSCVLGCLLELIYRDVLGAGNGGRGRLQRSEQLLEKKWVWILPDRGKENY